MDRAFNPWQPIPHLWDDLRFPASQIDPAGSTAPPTRDTTTGLLLFSGTLDNIVGGVAEMSHEWLEGTVIIPHLHIRFPTAAAGVNTRWKFEYDIADVGGNFSNAYGTYTTLATITVANPNNALKAERASFGDLSMAGFSISAHVMWRLTRLAASDAADTDTNDAALMHVDFHYMKDSFGSTAEREK